MSAGLLLVLGLVLCLMGAWSVRVAVLLSGFGLAWVLCDALGASFGTALVVSLAGALAAFVLTLVLSKFLMFFSGAVVGAVIGAKLFSMLGNDASWVLALVFVPAVAVVSGFLSSHYQRRFLVWATAFAGAALILSGLAELNPDAWGGLRHPSGPAAAAIDTVLWVGLGLLGRTVQLRRPLRRAGQPAA
jgi:hypothetical protein